MGREMVVVHTPLLMAIAMLASFLTIDFMEKVSIFGQMEMSIKESFQMANIKELENLSFLMAMFIEEALKGVSVMVKEHLRWQMAHLKLESGKMTS